MLTYILLLSNVNSLLFFFKTYGSVFVLPLFKKTLFGVYFLAFHLKSLCSCKLPAQGGAVSLYAVNRCKRNKVGMNHTRLSLKNVVYLTVEVKRNK